MLLRILGKCFPRRPCKAVSLGMNWDLFWQEIWKEGPADQDPMLASEPADS